MLCPRCSAALDPGLSTCPICDLPVVGGAADLTRIDPGPSTPISGSPVPPRYGPPPGYGPPPAYGPAPGYGAPPAYGPAPAYGPGLGYGPPGYGPPGYGPGLPAPRSKVAAALLCFFLGSLGIHRFYTGQVGLGLALLLTTLILGPLTCGLWLIATTVWVIVDFVLILTGGVRDQWGRPLT